MAVIKCSSCGKDVSSDAAACPSCGHPMKKKSGGWWWKIPLAIVGLIVLISAVGGLSGNRSSAGLPKCDSAKAKSDVMDAMKNSPAGRAGGLSIVTFENPGLSRSLLKMVQQAPSVECYAARLFLAMGWSPSNAC